jgi:hypothetical protein
LAARPLPIVTTTSGWVRVYALRHAPIFFGRTGRYRFDAPHGENGVLYAGNDIACAFVETFGHSLDIRTLTLEEVRLRGIAEIVVARPLRLADLTGNGLARIGADNRLCTADYLVAQRWSHALWHHPDVVDGIFYRSRLDPGRQCVAIFDRAADAVTASALGSLADPPHEHLLASLLDMYGIGLL